MHKIVGLDLGTNSIGWAVVDKEDKKIDAAGSRIIPMSGDILSDFEKGNTVSQTQARTAKRGARRILERRLLRRERMLRILKLMDFLPPHFAEQLSRYGHFAPGAEPKLAWREGKDGKMEFLFQASFDEMMADFRAAQPQWLQAGHKVPYDWTIYYLRHKALSKPLTKEELSWVLLQFNQKRGYNPLRGEDEKEDTSKREEYAELKVLSVEDSGDHKGKDVWYNIKLENGLTYRRSSKVPLDWVGKTKQFILTTSLNPDGTEKKDKDGVVKISIRSPKEDDWGLRKIRTESLLERSQTTPGDYIYQNLLQHPEQKIIGQFLRTIDRRYYKAELKTILDKQKEFLPQLTDADLYARCIQELYPHNDAYRATIAGRDFTYLLQSDILFYQRPLKSKKSLIDNCPYEVRYHKDENGNTIPVPVKCVAKSHPLFQEFRIWQFISNLRIYKKQDTIEGRLVLDNDVTAQFLPNSEAYAELYDCLHSFDNVDQKKLLQSAFFGFKKKELSDYRWNYVEDKVYPCATTHMFITKGLASIGVAQPLSADSEMLLWEILFSVHGVEETKKALKTFAAKHQLPQDDFADYFSRKVLPDIGYAAYSLKALRRLLPLMRQGKYWNEDSIDDATKTRIEHLIHHTPDDTISQRVRNFFDKQAIAENEAKRRAESGKDDSGSTTKRYAFTALSQCQGLPVWVACYLVYDRHSEAKELQKWNNPEDIDLFLQHFKQHSMRNPIVEQVVTETLRTVRDIWRQTGRIDEIHVEMGRDMKRTREERELLSKNIQANELTNQRLRILLLEFLNHPDFEITGVRPQSPGQLEIFKIYEDGAIHTTDEAKSRELDEMLDIRQRITSADIAKRPTHAELLRYKCWLDQGYVSPYTGRVIPLGRLFTEDYQIEHIIPQSRYFDDSLSNKVICESEVNTLKDRMLAHEFINNHHGEKVPLTAGGSVEILSPEAYEELVRIRFAHQRAKLRKLMLDEIPDGFIERQMNDSRYISRYITALLSSVVRMSDENGNMEQESTSRKLIACNGTITDRLKHEWGIDDTWNRIILPRFQRLNEIAGSNDYTATTANGHLIPDVPLEQRIGFSKKRIDHRHHAMDAIVIACTTRDHVNLLNNEAAKSKNVGNRYALQRKLRNFTTYIGNDGKQHEKAAEFLKPWETFNQDVYDALQGIIVSFKQNQRVINRNENHYVKFIQGRDGTWKKKVVPQEGNDNWAIRKSLHKETVFGEVNLQLKKEMALLKALDNPQRIVSQEVKDKVKELTDQGMNAKQIVAYFKEHTDEWSELAKGKVEVYYYTKETNDHYFATRFLSDLITLFSGCKKETDAEKVISAITDTGIQKILRNHLAAEGGDPVVAFSADGVERMNANLQQLNDGRQHQPIRKVRRFEQASKFAVGAVGNKCTKFVEADKGTNLFFLIYRTADNAGRAYISLPLHFIIDCQKKYDKTWRTGVVPELISQNQLPADAAMLFLLSPNDLVYAPTEQEQTEGITQLNPGQIYKMVSCGKSTCYFVSQTVAKVIKDKVEIESGNKSEKDASGRMIKAICLPLVVDRLGNVTSLETE
jgi:CRISPR-associated endonuclease Csn1